MNTRSKNFSFALLLSALFYGAVANAVPAGIWTLQVPLEFKWLPKEIASVEVRCIIQTSRNGVPITQTEFDMDGDGVKEVLLGESVLGFTMISTKKIAINTDGSAKTSIAEFQYPADYVKADQLGRWGSYTCMVTRTRDASGQDTYMGDLDFGHGGIADQLKPQNFLKSSPAPVNSTKQNVSRPALDAP